MLCYCCNTTDKSHVDTVEEGNSSTSNDTKEFSSLGNPFYGTVPAPNFSSRKEEKKKKESGAATSGVHNLENPVYGSGNGYVVPLGDLQLAPASPTHNETLHFEIHQVDNSGDGAEDNSNGDGMADHVYAIPDKKGAKRIKEKTCNSSTMHDQDGIKHPVDASDEHNLENPIYTLGTDCEVPLGDVPGPLVSTLLTSE